jgi:hypothetical protein
VTLKEAEAWLIRREKRSRRSESAWRWDLSYDTDEDGMSCLPGAVYRRLSGPYRNTPGLFPSRQMAWDHAIRAVRLAAEAGWVPPVDPVEVS